MVLPFCFLTADIYKFEWSAGWHPCSSRQSCLSYICHCLFSGCSKTDKDRYAENRLDFCRVEQDKQLQREFELQEVAQEVHSVLSLLDDRRPIYIGILR